MKNNIFELWPFTHIINHTRSILFSSNFQVYTEFRRSIYHGYRSLTPQNRWLYMPRNYWRRKNFRRTLGLARKHCKSNFNSKMFLRGLEAFWCYSICEWIGHFLWDFNEQWWFVCRPMHECFYFKTFVKTSQNNEIRTN